MIPTAPGCVITTYVGRAWVGKYPDRIGEGPKSNTNTWLGERGLSCNGALKLTLMWLWDRHTERHPEDRCPFDIGSLAD